MWKRLDTQGYIWELHYDRFNSFKMIDNYLLLLNNILRLIFSNIYRDEYFMDGTSIDLLSVLKF